MQLVVPAAQAQSTGSAAAPIASPQAHCALHVWPAAVTHTTFAGWFHWGAVDGAQRGIKGYPAMHPDVLDLAQQVRLLSQIDWHLQTGDPDLVVVIHPTASGSDDDRRRTTRLVTDAGSCYRELIITSSIIEAETFSSQSVRIAALRKKFDTADGIPVNFATMSMAVIQMPEKTDAQYPERLRAAMQAAFVVAINKFVVMQSFH